MARPKKEKPNRTDGRYEVKAVIGKNFKGEPIRKSFYSYESKADAKRQAEEYKVEMEVAARTGETFISEDITFGEWAIKWLNVYKKGTVKDNTFSKYKNALDNHLIPHFGKTDIKNIKQIDVQNFFNKQGKKSSRESLKIYYSCLNSIMETAIDNDFIIKNPCRNIKLTSKKAPIKKSVYTAGEASLVLDYAKQHRFGAEIAVLIRLGLRRGELLGIKWEDIDFENKTLEIKRAVADVMNSETDKMEIVVDKPKTTFSQRLIPIPNDIFEMLSNLPRSIIIGKNVHKNKPGKEIETEFVFHNSQGKVCSPRTWSRRHYDVFMTEMRDYYLSQEPPIDIPKLNPHELRHTLATLLVNDDKNLFAIASLLGWGDLKMLRQRYAHIDIESTRKSLGY